jgi:hypothetical protein
MMEEVEMWLGMNIDVQDISFSKECRRKTVLDATLAVCSTALE